MIEFCIISPGHNAAKWVGRCIDSVRAQSYPNWRMVVIDDMSGDGMADAAGRAAGSDTRITVVRNRERKYGLRNYVEAIDRYAPNESVIAILDADDRLADPNALCLIADEYASDGSTDILWTKCRKASGGWGPSDEAHISHLKTFRRGLMDAVNRRCLRDENGNYWQAATDVALMEPLLQVAGKRTHLPTVAYIYNDRANTTNELEDQAKTAASIRARTKRLEPPWRTKNVLFFVSGPAGGDRRFNSGERRPPLGILGIMRRLKARGHGVRLVDRFANHSWWPARETLEWAEVAGLYCSSANLPDARWVIQRLREQDFKGKILVGGPHITSRKELLPGADVACVGEADFAISDLVERDGPTRIHLAGLAGDDGEYRLDAVPRPLYEYMLGSHPTLSAETYRRTWDYDGTDPVWPLNTSRGCPHNCAFCESHTVSGRKWRAQSPERVANDVEWLAGLGAKGIYFREDNFGFRKDRLHSICELMLKRGSRVKWACEIRADAGADPELIEHMARAGCRGLYVGAESGSPRMLKLFRKGITVGQVEQTCANAARHGIEVGLSFVVDHPSEDAADRRATKDLIRRVGPRRAWLNRYRAPFQGASAG